MKDLFLPGIVPGIICLRVAALFTGMCMCAWGWEGLFMAIFCVCASMPLITCFILAVHFLQRLPRKVRFPLVMAAGLLMSGYYFDWPGLHERVYVSDWGPDPYTRSQGDAMRWMGIASVVLGVASAWRLLQTVEPRRPFDSVVESQKRDGLHPAAPPEAAESG